MKICYLYQRSWCCVSVCIGMLLAMLSCQHEMPVLSTITIDAESQTQPVNPELYGLSLEEINHAIDGGLYAEMISNRSFEEGVPPLNCPFDVQRRLLFTPNGWSIPFLRSDSIPGWRRYSPNTFMMLDAEARINEYNKRSLLVSVSSSAGNQRGGVVAEGYRGISLSKDENYQLSFWSKGASFYPKTVRVALVDSATQQPVSDELTLLPTMEWRHYKHRFTAKADLHNARLAFMADSATTFWLDVVSLFPEKTWKGRHNGQRADLMEKIADLHPRFIRFPGGSFVEGYTAGTFPIWRETVGPIEMRKSFWNVWAYGSTNGMGFHEYLQLCEDLGAEPIYVVNSGVTSQTRRPRFEDITAMNRWVQDVALDALAYANAPADSLLGSLRAQNGHPEPFHLKYIEVGSENHGPDYEKRFALFREAIKENYPDVMVISSSSLSKRSRGDWSDAHYHAGADYFIANHNRYTADRHYRRSQGLFIGEFGAVGGVASGTMQAALGEACFLLGVESQPEMVRRLAYAPVLENVSYHQDRPGMIRFDNHRVLLTPSYHLWKLFVDHRGDDVLKTNVDTYGKPQVSFGGVAVRMFDNSYDLQQVSINGRPVSEGTILSGDWKVNQGELIPVPNRWNYLLMGDTSAYNYEFTAQIRRTKGSGQIQFHLRDNGYTDERCNYVGFTIGAGQSEFFHQTGGVRDTLASPKPFAFQSNRWYQLRFVCQEGNIRCYVDDELIHTVDLRPLPSLVALATLDKEHKQVLLKVVNTTQHEERTELVIRGLSVKNKASLVELASQPEAANSFADPERIRPVSKEIEFSLGLPMVYVFPPSSVTILKLSVE